VGAFVSHYTYNLIMGAGTRGRGSKPGMFHLCNFSRKSKLKKEIYQILKKR
jgi:hypothetical protein